MTPWAAGPAVLVIGGIAAELAVRAAFADLRHAQHWHDSHAQAKERRMTELARSGGSRVVVVGSSIVATGIDAGLITGKPTATAGYNAGINRGVPTVLQHWVLERVIPLLRPDAVVICLSSLELNDNSVFSREVQESYYASPVHRGRFLRWVLGLRLLYLTLVVRRRLLGRLGRNRAKRTWGDRLDALVPRRTFGAYRRWLDMTQTGQSRIYLDASHRPSPTRDAKFVRDIVNDYAAGGVQTAALDRIVSALRARGVHVTLVFLPHTAEYVGLHPRGPEDVTAARNATARIATRHAVPFVDLLNEISLQPAEMADCIHPNASGSHLLSEALRRSLSAIPDVAMFLNVSG